MMGALLHAFAAPALIGLLLAHAAWPGGGARRWAVKAPLGIGLGLGVTSCLYFLWRALIGEPSPGLFVTEWAGVAVLAAWTFARRAGPSEELAPPGARDRALTVAFGVLLAFAAATWCAGLASTPGGEWDAVAIWNLKARFLFRGGADWTDMFREEMTRSHRDYPLLLPGAVARAWTACGADTQVAPMAVAGLFGLATLGLLFAALNLLRGSARGLLAALALAATPNFIHMTTIQYADVPLGFFVLAGVVLFLLHDRAEGRAPGLMALAGLACGLAAWTKNEGLLILAVVVATRACFVLRGGGFVAWRREFGLFLAGAAPVLVVIALFKLRYAAANYIVGQDWGEAAIRMTEFSRVLLIAKKLALNLCLMGAAPGMAWLPLGAAPLMLAGLALCGAEAPARDRRALAAAGTALALVTAAYLGVYLVTPLPLEWQLNTSLGRLLLHLWPAAIFLFFMAVRAPAEGDAALKAAE